LGAANRITQFVTGSNANKVSNLPKG
jgi:hypothetical protein